MSQPDFELVEVARCPICGSEGHRLVGTSPTIHPESPLRIEVRRCLACAHWFSSPIPPQPILSGLYEQGSEFVVTKGWQGKKTTLSVPERFVLNQESSGSGNEGRRRSYLEIGVGDGVLLKKFTEAGWDCTAVDPGPAPEWTRHSKVRFAPDLSQIVGTSADTIVMMDVLEHVVDPIALLGAAARLAAGTVYLSFPNSQSLRAILGGVRWRMVRPLGHLHYFSRQSLGILLERAGLNPERVQRTDLRRFPRTPSARLPLDLGIYCAQLCLESQLGDQWIVCAKVSEAQEPLPH